MHRVHSTRFNKGTFQWIVAGIKFTTHYPSQANDLCNAEQKKTVSHEHVLRGSFSNISCYFNEISCSCFISALDSLGYGAEYLEAAGSVILLSLLNFFVWQQLIFNLQVMSNCREAAARRLQRQNSRLENLGIPEEELLRKQQELFQKVSERIKTLY